MNIEPIIKCRVCKSDKLIDILSLGNQTIVDFSERNIKVPIELIRCDKCGLVQLRHTTPPDLLYKHYWYKSGISNIIKDNLFEIAKEIEDLLIENNIFQLYDNVVDIGCNDGTMFQYYDLDLTLIGFEPADNLIEDAKVFADKIFNNYFNAEDWKKHFGTQKAKVITAISMFYDLDDPNKFLDDITKILDKDGFFVIQQNYLVSMLEQTAFDNIVHEHLEYYCLYTLENLLKKHGLEVFDVKICPINGGSFRTYIKFRGSKIRGTEGAEDRLRLMREDELFLELKGKNPYEEFAERANEVKKKLREFLCCAKFDGKTVYIYGASTRGNTTMQFCDIDNTMIPYAIEKNPAKFGKIYGDTNIPIISMEQFREEYNNFGKPEYLLILPWHLLDEFIKNEKEYLNSGGKFIVPLPSFRIMGGENFD